MGVGGQTGRTENTKKPSQGAIAGKSEPQPDPGRAAECKLHLRLDPDSGQRAELSCWVPVSHRPTAPPENLNFSLLKRVTGAGHWMQT